MPRMSKTARRGGDSAVRGRKAAGTPAILFAGEETASPETPQCATCHEHHAKVLALLEELAYLASGRNIEREAFLGRVYSAITERDTV